jgi:GNAT superfamily N-acetyltransferase
VRIVPFKPRHAQGFFELSRAWLVAHELWDASHTDELSDPLESIGAIGGRVYIAERRGSVAGSCAVVPRRDGVMEIKWLAVEPEWQRLGIGRRMLTRGAGYARRHGAMRIVTVTSERLSAALRLYRRFGFESAPAPPGLRQPPEGIYMQLDLAPASVVSGHASHV